MNLWRSRPAAPRPPALVPTAGVPGTPSDRAGSILERGLMPAGGDGLPDPTVPQAGEMPFLDHLEELRWHIFKALVGIFVAAGVCLFFGEWIIENILLAQTRRTFFMYPLLGLDAVDVVLQNRSVTGQFFAYYGTVLASALVVGSPVIVYQIWKFVEPGLYPGERTGIRSGAVFATFFFATGIAFGYLVLSPFALQYFAQFTISASIVNEFDITKYFSMLLTWTFGAGLLFELPVVVVVLAKLDIVTTKLLTGSRRFAFVIILVLAAVFTPPDPLSMIILAIPLLLLYELSIGLTRYVERGKRKAALATEAAAAAAIAAGAVTVSDAPGDVPTVMRPD